MIAYIDKHRSQFGVEPICSVLQFAQGTYYGAKARPPSARALRDAGLKPEIGRVHRDNFGVYGVDKVWAQLNPGRPAGRPLHGRLSDARARAPRRRPWQADVHDSL